MPAKYPGLIKSIQVVSRGSWPSATHDDTISAVQTDRTVLIPINSGNNRIYGGSDSGDQTEYINFELYTPTTFRWTREAASAPAWAYPQLVKVVEFFEPLRGITTATTSRLQGVGSSGSPTQQNTNVPITPPAGASVGRYLCLPACLMPDYGGNPTYFWPILSAIDNVRFTWAYGSDVYRTMKARVYWL